MAVFRNKIRWQHQLFIVVNLIITHLVLTNCLYQDQVGKFDWRKQFIGIPKFVYFHPGTNNIIIGTESNVVASLQSKDGSIIWRQLLPEGCVLGRMSIMKSSEDIREYLVETHCHDVNKATNQTDIWNPESGLLVSKSRYNKFAEDDLAESEIADSGHLVDTSRAFKITEGSSLVVSDEGQVTYQAHNGPVWSREESLASITAVEIIKLPTTMRDSFGLKKIIVALTRRGRLFGLDTFTGEIIWHLFDKDLSTNCHESKHVKLIVTKESDDESEASRAIVIHPRGFIVNFNPVSGKFLDKKQLPNGIKQIAQTDSDTSDASRGVIILDTKDNVHVYPETLIDRVKSDINKYYMTIVQTSPPTLSGYKFAIASNTIVPKEVWTFPINMTEKIVDLSIKRIGEEIHSPARVLGDRGILYKYVNPNLVAVMTEGSLGDICTAEQSINIYLIDGVTGALVHFIHHPKSRGPAKMVHSENWLVYSYYNIKSRRTEVSSLEMFEGVHQVDSSTFSSLTRSHIKPVLIQHKSFIFPSGINAMVDTVTLRGMTNKHVIVALPSGGLLEIPRIFLDPRRPINMLMEHREEGLIPYMPELSIASEGILNYDQTLMAVKKIVTSPAILESTSLVFAYGLDIFFTRVTPSKTFDILKDDFDHVLIASVLLFLIVASLVSKYLAQRKALHAAWK